MRPRQAEDDPLELELGEAGEDAGEGEAAAWLNLVQAGIEGDDPGTSAVIENVTIDGMAENGLWADQSAFTVRNTIVTHNKITPPPGYLGDFGKAALGSFAGSHNTSTDSTASTAIGGDPNAHTLVDPANIFVLQNSNLHLKAGGNPEVDGGLDLSPSFVVATSTASVVRRVAGTGERTSGTDSRRRWDFSSSGRTASTEECSFRGGRGRSWGTWVSTCTGPGAGRAHGSG